MCLLAVTLLLAAAIGCGSPPAPAATAVPTEPATQVAPTASAVETAQSTDPLPIANFVIISAESQARFELDEHLRSAETSWAIGAPFTVVGTTDQVTGTFAFSPSNLDATEFGPITLDAHSFKTSNFYRTTALQKTILESRTYPTITFAPTAIRDLPARAALGTPVTFTLAGDLTIRDLTLAQTFTVTATMVAADRVEGTAATTVSRDDYNLEIRVAPHVTNVEDTVELYIDFVARRE